MYGVCGGSRNKKRREYYIFLVKMLRLINFSTCHLFILTFVQLIHRLNVYILKNMKSMTK